jgi:hypothetical protein
MLADGHHWLVRGQYDRLEGGDAFGYAAESRAHLVVNGRRSEQRRKVEAPPPNVLGVEVHNADITQGEPERREYMVLQGGILDVLRLHAPRALDLVGMPAALTANEHVNGRQHVIMDEGGLVQHRGTTRDGRGRARQALPESSRRLGTEIDAV